MTTISRNLFAALRVLALYAAARVRMVGRRPMDRVRIINRLDRDLAALQAK